MLAGQLGGNLRETHDGQAVTDLAEMRGRAMSLLMLAVVGLLPFSIAFAGILAQIGLPVLFVASGALVIAAAAGGFVSGRLHAVE